MAVLGVREILPRTYEHRMGDSPTAGRVVAVTVDQPTATSAILETLGVSHGDPHPDHTGLVCNGISVDETDRQHVTVTLSYGVSDKREDEDPDTPPWLQPDQWSFGASNSTVPCMTHYAKVGIVANAIKSLVNAAGDQIHGITRAEGELKISITGSRLTLDLASYKGFVNAINDRTWAGFPAHTVQCVGFSAAPARLEFQGEVVDYWQITFELMYRQSTFNIWLPNVGWHVLVDGKKQRAWSYVKDDDTGALIKVPSPHPVSLNMNGGFLCGANQDQAADPGYGGEFSN